MSATNATAAAASGCPFLQAQATAGGGGAAAGASHPETAASSLPRFPFARPSGAIPPSEFAKLRATAPVSRVQLWDGSSAWLLARHADAVMVLDDPRFSKNRSLEGFPELSQGGRLAAKSLKHPTFVDMDPPEHGKQRGMVAAYFTREAADAMRPAIQRTVDEGIAKMRAAAGEGKGDGKALQPVDLVPHLALPVPSITIFSLIGLPRADMDKLLGFSSVRSNGSSTAAQAAQANDELLAYLHAFVQKREEELAGADPDPQAAAAPKDVISRLILDERRTGALTRDMLVQIAFLLLVAGNATAVSMIALGVVTLLQHPDQLAALKADWSLLGPAVEELVRFHTASSFATRRVALVDVTLHGQLIRKGEGVIAATQSGNRDESVFGSDAEEFNIRRFAPGGSAKGPQLGFGTGAHQCVAEWLARAELELALGSLFKELPNLRLAHSLDQVKYSEPTRDVGISELTVTWDADAKRSNL